MIKILNYCKNKLSKTVAVQFFNHFVRQSFVYNPFLCGYWVVYFKYINIYAIFIKNKQYISNYYLILIIV